MKLARHLVSFGAAILCLALLASPAAAVGSYYTLVPNPALPGGNEIQVAAFSTGLRSTAPGDMACDVYLGTDLFTTDNPSEDEKRKLVELADQAFEEVIGVECAKRVFQNKADAKWYPIPRCIIHVNSTILLLKGRQEFPKSREGEGGVGFGDLPLLVEYRLKSPAVGVAVRPETTKAPEYIRVTHPEIPVGPSIREPNLPTTTKEIEPGVTINLENTLDHTYSGRSEPTVLIFYQTSIPIADWRNNQALAKKVVEFFAGVRLKEDELRGVRTGAFNEPKRSRFHFRPSFAYEKIGDWSD